MYRLLHYARKNPEQPLLPRILPTAFFYFLKCHLFSKIFIQICNGNSFLFHGITVSYSNSTIFYRIKVIRNTVRSTNLVLTAVSLTDISSVIKLTVIVLGKLCIYLLCTLV